MTHIMVSTYSSSRSSILHRLVLLNLLVFSFYLLSQSRLHGYQVHRRVVLYILPAEEEIHRSKSSIAFQKNNYGRIRGTCEIVGLHTKSKWSEFQIPREMDTIA